MPARHMKIALMGACCTKKTTTVTAVAERGAARVVPEQAREHFESVPIEDRHTLEAQVELAERIIAIERQTAENGGVLLCDRSVLDGVAYLRHAGSHDQAERLLEQVSYWLPTYERFVLCDPAGIPFKRDAVRTETPEERDSLHRAFLELFDDLGIPYELMGGTEQDRLARVLEMLEEAACAGQTP